MLITYHDMRIIQATTGEIIRTLTAVPNGHYHGTARPTGGPKDPEKSNGPDPERGSGPSSMSRDITLWSWGESNPRPSAGVRTCYDHSRYCH